MSKVGKNNHKANNPKNFTDNGFWNKTKKYAKKAGENVIFPALKMYYSSQDKDTPTWAKTTIFGALAYFISPIDAIPDIMPVVGYTDDMGVLATAISAVAMYIKNVHETKAKEKLEQWFS